MSGFFTAKYMVKKGNGMQTVEHDFFLPDAISVRREIAHLGGIPLTVRHKKPKWWQREMISGSYKLSFLQSLAFHVGSGMSPGKALKLVIEGETDTNKRYELDPALEVLNRGGSFTIALQALGMFDSSVIAILSSGERIGALKEVTKSAVEHMREKGKTWKVLTAALTWVSFDVFTSVSTVFSIQFGYLPWLEKNGIDSRDPKAIAKFETAVQGAYIINGALMWISIIFCIVAAIAAWNFMVKKQKQHLGKEETEENWFSRITLFQGFIENTGMGETFGIAGRMLSGHVPFSEAARVAADASPVPSVKKLWKDALSRISRGDTIDKAMRAPVLTKAETLQISAHQNSEQLSVLFLNIAEERSGQAKKGVQRIIMGGIMVTILYTFIAAATALWVLWVQNEGVSASLDSISSGAF